MNIEHKVNEEHLTVMQVPRGSLRPQLSRTTDRTNRPCCHKFESAVNTKNLLKKSNIL